MAGGSGRIVAISGNGAHDVIPGYVAVGVSKAALESLKDYFRSHPPAQERINQVHEMITENGWGNLTSERPLKVAGLLRRALEKPVSRQQPAR